MYLTLVLGSAMRVAYAGPSRIASRLTTLQPKSRTKDTQKKKKEASMKNRYPFLTTPRTTDICLFLEDMYCKSIANDSIKIAVNFYLFVFA